MITRIWHGYTTHENAESYENTLKSEVMAEIAGKKIEGFHELKLLRRALGDEVEFVTIMRFDSLEAIRAFAGEDYEKAFVPAAARKVLKRFDERVKHYKVRYEYEAI